jgi:lipopolysaccharide transport system permease protein
MSRSIPGSISKLMFENFKELYKYRTLFWALVKRHLAMRYRGSVLGFVWSFLNPLLLMLVYTLVFKYYIRFNNVENYTIFVFCGLLPWIWFTSSLSEGTSSIVSSGHLITKSMFPAHLLPAVAVVTNMIHFVLSLPLLFIFMFFLNSPFHASLILLPFIVLMQFFMMWGIVLALSSLNVFFRDVQHLLANFLTLLFFLCPVLYPLSSVPERFRFTMELNPIAQITIFYHQVIIEGVVPGAKAAVFVGASVAALFIIGNMVYNRYRESFAECI